MFSLIQTRTNPLRLLWVMVEFVQLRARRVQPWKSFPGTGENGLQSDLTPHLTPNFNWQRRKGLAAEGFCERRTRLRSRRSALSMSRSPILPCMYSRLRKIMTSRPFPLPRCKLLICRMPSMPLVSYPIAPGGDSEAGPCSSEVNATVAMTRIAATTAENNGCGQT